MIKHLSYTSLSSFLRCPKSFYYRYFEKIPVPLKGRLLCGRCYHHALAVAESRKLLFNEQLTKDDVGDAFSSFWEHELQDKLVYDELGDEKIEAKVVDFSDEDPGKLKDSGIKLAQLYVAEVLPKLEITGIEKRLTAEVDGIIPFVGYTDLLLAGDIVVDHKFSKRRLSDEDIAKDIQLSSYALLMGKPITGQFHIALDTKEKDIHIVETKRDESDIERMNELIRDCWAIIQNGVFPRNQTWWGCGPDCSYYLDCLHPDF